MPKYVTLILLVCAVLWVAAGCTKTANDVTGAGYEMLTPLPTSRQFIIANDIEFARQVLAHNTTCKSQPGCSK
jgi:hypothetical protein